MTTVTTLLRHPLKGHGREALEQVTLIAGQTMPYDRLWAVAHDHSKADGSEWAPCANFMRTSKAPGLMAISSTLDTERNQLTLSHPDKPDFTFDPDDTGQLAGFIEWVMPLVPTDRALPDRIIKIEGHGFVDSDFPSVTLCNAASHRAVEDQVGHPLSINRWRGNIWFDTGTAWEEFDWMGRQVQVGECVFKVRERTDRCLATSANPDTGIRDVDTLKALDHFGHQDFSVRTEVVQGGTIRLGDTVKVI